MICDLRDRALIALGLVLCLLASAGLGLMVFIVTAKAHDDWPAACCSDRDCAEVPDSMIRETEDRVFVEIPPGAHPMWGPEKTENFKASVARSDLKPPVKGNWGVCIDPFGRHLCTILPKRFG